MSNPQPKPAHLNASDLMAILRGIADAPPEVTVTHDFLVYGLSAEVLRFFFGNEWTNENVFSVHPTVSAPNRKGRAFLRTDSNVLSDHLRHRQRVTRLAESSFNLQAVEGFGSRAKLLVTHDLESILGEIECTTLLAHPALGLRLVTPTGCKGQDYEAEVRSAHGRLVSCEIKVKAEETSLSLESLKNSLETARKQLPKSSPGIVIVRLPEGWIQSPTIQGIAETAVSSVFCRSQRLVAIVFVWGKWIQVPESWWLVTTRFREYPNRRSPLYDADIDELLGHLGHFGPGWVPFQTLVQRSGLIRVP